MTLTIISISAVYIVSNKASKIQNSEEEICITKDCFNSDTKELNFEENNILNVFKENKSKQININDFSIPSLKYDSFSINDSKIIYKKYLEINKKEKNLDEKIENIEIIKSKLIDNGVYDARSSDLISQIISTEEMNTDNLKLSKFVIEKAVEKMEFDKIEEIIPLITHKNSKIADEEANKDIFEMISIIDNLREELSWAIIHDIINMV